ncbi:MAG: hypothetical protein SAJ37_17795 [Oscillatoria sp. PMC 1068.18]|nr:hypothetical protein [Oscillatoria sp. PMC 1076.18]MEC4990588.1 hypothetical protein [Oscillatoria sp. PMC 1068.18]
MKSIRRALGLAVLTLLVVILFGRSPWLVNFSGKPTLELPAVAQTPTPTESPATEVTPETQVTPEATPSTELSPEREATPEASPSPVVSPEPETTPSPVATPEPEITPSPIATPEPEITPEPIATPEPEITPSPIATPEPEPEAPARVEIDVPPLPLAAEPYLDPAQRFQIGIVEGFSVSSVGGSPLIESPDGNVAYTVVVRSPLLQEPLRRTRTSSTNAQSRTFENNLSDAALAQIAVDTFDRGEGFLPGEFASIGDGIVIAWNGSLSLRGKSQPISGLILSRQVPGNVLLMLISATEEGEDEVEAVLSTVANTLQSI